MLLKWRVGDVIRRLRIEADNMGVAVLSQRSGVNLTTINRIELHKTRDPKDDTLERIGVVFGLTAKQIRAAVPDAVEIQAALPTWGKTAKKKRAG